MESIAGKMSKEQAKISSIAERQFLFDYIASIEDQIAD